MIEIDTFIYDKKQSKKKLRWTPKIRFKELAKIMIDADMRAAGLEAIGEGDEILEEKFPNRWWGVD